MSRASMKRGDPRISAPWRKEDAQNRFASLDFQYSRAIMGILSFLSVVSMYLSLLMRIWSQNLVHSRKQTTFCQDYFDHKHAIIWWFSEAFQDFLGFLARYKGKVRSFSDAKGFGFIDCQDPGIPGRLQRKFQEQQPKEEQFQEIYAKPLSKDLQVSKRNAFSLEKVCFKRMCVFVSKQKPPPDDRLLLGFSAKRDRRGHDATLWARRFCAQIPTSRVGCVGEGHPDVWWEGCCRKAWGDWS